jgi:uncharacterized SAM-binding protein YcdF (DUF218 family)
VIATAAPQTKATRWLFWTAIVALAFLLSVIGSTARSILLDSGKQELGRADAIIVFGAAEYDGRPSPVFRARLDHANDLFRQGLAPIVITSGGAASDPKYTEGGVGHDYLMRKGIPESALIAETQASDTSESARRVAVIMRANHLRSCIAVSDGYHVFRIRKMLEHERVQVYVAPRSDSATKARTRWQRFVSVMRETISYLLWRAGIRG